jgi:hypothetical protein
MDMYDMAVEITNKLENDLKVLIDTGREVVSKSAISAIAEVSALKNLSEAEKAEYIGDIQNTAARFEEAAKNIIYKGSRNDVSRVVESATASIRLLTNAAKDKDELITRKTAEAVAAKASDAVVNTIVAKYGVDVNVAKSIAGLVGTGGITAEAIATTANDILTATTDEITTGDYIALKANVVDKKKQLIVNWSKQDVANGYIVMGAKLGDKYEILATFDNPDTLSYTYTGAKKNKYYKFIVLAYKNIDGKQITTAVSKTLYASLKGSKKSNTKKLKIRNVKDANGKVTGEKKEITLNVGDTAKLNIKVVNETKIAKKIRKVKFESDNTGIVKVNAAYGTIEGVKAGKSTVYAYAQNGKAVQVSVTVK